MFQQEFAALETFGKIFFNGFFDHTRTGETDQCAGLGNIQVTQHTETGGDAAKCWIGK